MAQFYLPPNSIQTSGKKQQALDGLYWSVLYSLRFSINDRCDYIFDFPCIDEDLIEELKTIKPQLNYSSKSSQLENKLHVINDTLIPYEFFLKV